MRRDVWRAAMAIVGAVIGAGFASGQEICTFFARFGGVSWLGIVCAVGLMIWTLGRVQRPPESSIWRLLFGLLTTVIGGAMLACAGEIAALALPIHGAYGIGVMMTTAMVVWANGRSGILSGVSRVLTIFLLVLLGAGCLFPGEGVALGQSGSVPMAALSGLCYGSFNAALAVPIVAELRPEQLRPALRRAGLVLGLLLIIGNAAMLCHPEAQGQTVPLIQLAGHWGKTGYAVCCITMSLAVLTTAIAADKGLAAMLPKRLRLLGPCLMLTAALVGFRGIVEWLYPALGAACFLLLAANRRPETGA